MIQAHRERKTITRRKKEGLRKEKAGRSGESKNQGTGNVFYLLYAFLFDWQGNKQTSKLDWTFNLVVIINWMRFIFCSQIEADRKNLKDREIRESVSVVIFIIK